MKQFLRIAALLALFAFPSIAEAANRFAVCATTCTWDGASTAMWSTTTGGGTGASVPGAADAVILDAATCVGGTTCTITVNTNFAVQSLTMGACTASTTGCILDFSVNNNSPTLNFTAGLSITGTGTRNLKCGTGTFTFSATAGTLIDLTTTTGLTLSCASATFAFTATTPTTTRSINLGGVTLGNVTVATQTSNTNQFVIVLASTTDTLTSLTIGGSTDLVLTGNKTLNLTNAPTWTGGSLSTPIFITTTLATFSTGSTTVAVASGTPNISFAALYCIVFTGSVGTATSSVDLGRNSGITITPPSGGGGGHIIGG